MTLGSVTPVPPDIEEIGRFKLITLGACCCLIDTMLLDGTSVVFRLDGPLTAGRMTVPLAAFFIKADITTGVLVDVVKFAVCDVGRYDNVLMAGLVLPFADVTIVFT